MALVLLGRPDTTVDLLDVGGVGRATSVDQGELLWTDRQCDDAPVTFFHLPDGFNLIAPGLRASATSRPNAAVG
jgi:hypothetical protein